MVPPLPQLAGGDLAVPVYIAISAFKILLLITFWQLLLIRPFEKSANAAFNPLLIKSLKLVGPEHLCREIFEVAYLNLLSLYSQIISFLNSSEHTGTLHSALRKFVERKKGEVATNVNFQIRRLSQWLYLTVIFSIALGII